MNNKPVKSKSENSSSVKQIQLININKIYPDGVHAVFDFNLTVKPGDFVVFVGPSGCGKSTTLRMIAGLENISFGTLLFDGKTMNSVSPRNRDVAMVFQNYALYPQLTVYKNISIGLKMRGVDEKKIIEKVAEAAKFLQLENYLTRRPSDLSGGQRQRVALGRAIVRDARLTLMDEPLSNLDAKLRGEMRTKILELHKKFHKTTIYVTHDQVEAMTMADRIVVMKDGFIEQAGTPKEIYDNPINEFVAKFIGQQEINIYDAVYEKNILHLDFCDLPIKNKEFQIIPSGKVRVGIRPSDIYEENSPVAMTYPKAFFECEIMRLENLGDQIVVNAQLKTKKLLTIILKNTHQADFYHIGKKARFWLNLSRINFFDAETGTNLHRPINDETKVALSVKEKYKIDVERKNALLKLQANKKTLAGKIKSLPFYQKAIAPQYANIKGKTKAGINSVKKSVKRD